MGQHTGRLSHLSRENQIADNRRTYPFRIDIVFVDSGNLESEPLVPLLQLLEIALLVGTETVIESDYEIAYADLPDQILLYEDLSRSPAECRS